MLTWCKLKKKQIGVEQNYRFDMFTGKIQNILCTMHKFFILLNVKNQFCYNSDLGTLFFRIPGDVKVNDNNVLTIGVYTMRT